MTPIIIFKNKLTIISRRKHTFAIFSIKLIFTFNVFNGCIFQLATNPILKRLNIQAPIHIIRSYCFSNSFMLKRALSFINFQRKFLKKIFSKTPILYKIAAFLPSPLHSWILNKVKINIWEIPSILKEWGSKNWDKWASWIIIRGH